MGLEALKKERRRKKEEEKNEKEQGQVRLKSKRKNTQGLDRSPKRGGCIYKERLASIGFQCARGVYVVCVDRIGNVARWVLTLEPERVTI